MRAYAAHHSVPQSDVPEMKADQHRDRHDWSAALVAYESAWSQYDGRGFCKAGKPYGAALCCLRLGRRAACVDWLNALSGEDKTTAELWRAELELRLSIAGEHYPADRTLLGAYLDRSIVLQGTQFMDTRRDLTARFHLLDTSLGDPTRSIIRPGKSCVVALRLSTT